MKTIIAALTISSLFSMSAIAAENNNQVITNQKIILNNLDKILNNQTKLDQIIDNQKTILGNQEKIQDNQKKLDTILQNQEIIIKKLGSKPSN
jgi:hypothetical protein